MQLERLTPDEHRGAGSDRRQGLTCAHKQPQGFACCCQHALLWLSHLLPRCALCSLVLGLQFSHMHVPSWRCSPKVHAQWWGQAQELKQVKCMDLHHHMGPRAGCWCSWRCTRLCRCWKGSGARGAGGTQLALVCMNTYGAKAVTSAGREACGSCIGHWFLLQW